jgi:hypothetical protein
VDLSDNSLAGNMPELPPSLVSGDLSLNMLSGGMPRRLPDGLAFLAAFGNRLTGQRAAWRVLSVCSAMSVCCRAVSWLWVMH